MWVQDLPLSLGTSRLQDGKIFWCSTPLQGWAEQAGGGSGRSHGVPGAGRSVLVFLEFCFGARDVWTPGNPGGIRRWGSCGVRRCPGHGVWLCSLPSVPAEVWGHFGSARGCARCPVLQPPREGVPVLWDPREGGTPQISVILPLSPSQWAGSESTRKRRAARECWQWGRAGSLLGDTQIPPQQHRPSAAPRQTSSEHKAWGRSGPGAVNGAGRDQGQPRG